MFQHTAARRRLDGQQEVRKTLKAVSTHSRPKAAGPINPTRPKIHGSFNTQPPEGGWDERPKEDDKPKVSTHSRPKAAGAACSGKPTADEVSTHSRPKAAGSPDRRKPPLLDCFNTQPPEGGWAARPSMGKTVLAVSTHSRPKAAGTQLKPS